MHLYSAFHQMIILSCLVMLLCTLTSGVTSHDHRKPICCTKKKFMLHEPKFKIKSCYIFPETSTCDAAVVFGDARKLLYCIDPEAPWLSKRMERLQMNNVTCEVERQY